MCSCYAIEVKTGSYSFPLKRGFTLIELLVVIAIIGILSSVVLASLNSARQKGRDTRRVADIKQIQLALELYYDGAGTYPDALSDENLVDTGYISVVPADPSGGDYFYSFVSATQYHIGANLENVDHPALNSDADFDSANISGSDGPDGCDDLGGGHCYDVRP
jgi:general secretion pathway protein G